MAWDEPGYLVPGIRIVIILNSVFVQFFRFWSNLGPQDKRQFKNSDLFNPVVERKIFPQTAGCLKNRKNVYIAKKFLHILLSMFKILMYNYSHSQCYQRVWVFVVRRNIYSFLNKKPSRYNILDVQLVPFITLFGFQNTVVHKKLSVIWVYRGKIYVTGTIWNLAALESQACSSWVSIVNKNCYKPVSRLRQL